MDPFTIVGLVASCLSIADKTTKAIHGGWELFTKYRDAKLSISTLLGRLETVTSALAALKGLVDYCIDNQGVAAAELLQSLERAVRGCHVVLAGLRELVEGLKQVKAMDKFKLLWNESTIQIQADNLDSQVNALNLVLNIMQM